MSKKELFDFIIKNRKYFISANNNMTKDEKYKKWINKQNIKLPIDDITEQNIYDYLLNESGKYCECGKVNKFNTLSKGYNKFCSKKCLHKWRSDNMLGESNNSHKMSEETKRNANRKQSESLKNKIANGEWTPCITNSWAKSRCIVKINRFGKDILIKCRSSWDAYFQIHNPNLLYEKIRIPYEWNGEIHNYIIDFVDIENKVLYEIKPTCLEDDSLNQIKFKAAESWAIHNDFKFIIINNEWFKENYNEYNLINQPDRMKISRLLKQFKHENKKNI